MAPTPPTPEEARARIKCVEALALSDAPMGDLVAAVKALHLGCSVQVVTALPGKRLFRGLRVKERPMHRSRVSYPPPGLASLGRANDIGQSLFYGAMGDCPGPVGRSNLLACAWELKAEDGDLLAIGEWEVIEPLFLYPFGFQAAEMYGMVRGQQPWITQSTPADTMALINAWESEAFTRVVNRGGERQYRVTVALTNYALGLRANFGESDRVSGIVYPAVATQLNSDNVCLTPGAADNGLALLGVWIINAKDMRMFADGDERPEEDAVGRAEITFHDSSHACKDSDEIRWPKRWVLDSIFNEENKEEPWRIKE